MKKRFSILIVSTVIIGLTLSLFGMALVSQTASAERAQNSYRQAHKPIPAANIKVVKKILLSSAVEETKGRPKPFSPPGQDKKKKSEGAATGILGEPLAERANKYAVIIGICDYPGEKNDICLSDGDALNMYDALVTLYGYNPDNISLFRDMAISTGNTTVNEVPFASKPATFNNISVAVTSAKQGDEVVFFFSGHGGWLRNEDDNPIDADPYDEGDGVDEIILVHDGNEAVGISDDMLVDWFSNFGTTRIIFIFDTCLAGGMNDLAGDGRIVVMSTKETQSAYVDSQGERGEGVFSRLFVNKGMLQGLADRYNQLKITDEKIVVEEAFDYAKRNIPGFLKRRQKPVISDDFENDLLL